MTLDREKTEKRNIETMHKRIISPRFYIYNSNIYLTMEELGWGAVGLQWSLLLPRGGKSFFSFFSFPFDV